MVVSAVDEEEGLEAEEALEVVAAAVVVLEDLHEADLEARLEEEVLASEEASLEVTEEGIEAAVEEASIRRILLVNKAQAGDQELQAEEAVQDHLLKADMAARLLKEVMVEAAVVDINLAVLLLVLLVMAVTSKFQEALLAEAAVDTIAEIVEEEEAMVMIEVVTATGMPSGRATEQRLFSSSKNGYPPAHKPTHVKMCICQISTPSSSHQLSQRPGWSIKTSGKPADSLVPHESRGSISIYFRSLTPIFLCLFLSKYV